MVIRKLIEVIYKNRELKAGFEKTTKMIENAKIIN